MAQLIEYFYEGDIFKAVGRVLHRIEEAYALGIICSARTNLAKSVAVE